MKIIVLILWLLSVRYVFAIDLGIYVSGTQFDTSLEKSIEISPDTIFFAQSGHVVKYNNKKKAIYRGKGESYKSSAYDIPKYLPNKSGIAIFHLITYWEPPHDISVTFYDTYGDTIGAFKTLWGAYPDFSPDGSYFIADCSDPYSEGIFDSSVRLCKINGEIIREISSFKEIFQKIFGYSFKHYQHIFSHFLFSEDGKVFAIPIRGISDKEPYEDENVHILFFNSEGIIVNSKKLITPNDNDVRKAITKYFKNYR